jgi:hypothetical protein
MNRAVITLIILGILAADLLLPLVGGTGGWSPPETLQDDLSSYVEMPSMAMNENGDAVIVWVQGSYAVRKSSGMPDYWSDYVPNGSIMAKYYHNGQWSLPLTVQSGSNCIGGLKVALNSYGDAVAVWWQLSAWNTDDAKIYASMFINEVWSSPQSIQEEPHSAFAPDVAISDNGEAVAVWVHFDSANSTTMIYANNYIGGSWGKDKAIESRIADADFPRVVIDSDGNALAAWWLWRTSSIYVNDFRNGLWGTSHELNEHTEGFVFDMAMNDDGKAVIVWTSSDLSYDAAGKHIGSNTYEDGVWNLAQTVYAADYIVLGLSISMNAGGDAIAVWYDDDGETIYGSDYIDGSWNRYEIVGNGAVKSVPLRYNRDYEIRSALDFNGNAAILWCHSDAPNSTNVLSYSVRTNGSWRPAEGFGQSQSILLAKVQIDNDLNALAVWTQNNTKVIDSQINLRDVQPMATIVTPSNGSVNYGNSLSVSWAATAYAYGATINSYTLSMDGIEKASLPASVSNYTIKGMTEGWHEVTLTVVDSNGNDFSTVSRFLIHVLMNYSPSGDQARPNSTISATFAQPMNTTSMTINVTNVDGSVDLAGDMIVLTPSSDLLFDTIYSANVSGKDTTGRFVSFSWNFSTMRNEGRIIGSIRDSSNNMASANITLSDGRVAQQFAGGFFFENVTSGTYNLTIQRQGFETMTLKVTVTAGDTTDLGTIVIKKQSFLDDMWVVAGISVVAVAVSLLVGWLVLKKRKG